MRAANARLFVVVACLITTIGGSAEASTNVAKPALRSAWMLRDGLAEYTLLDGDRQLVRHFGRVLEVLEGSSPSSIDRAVSEIVSLFGTAPSQEQIQMVRGALSESRRLNIACLREYRDRRLFPKNTRFEKPLPIFTDDLGVRCAVGHLMEVSGRRDIAEYLVDTNNLIYLDGNEDALVREWVRWSGLTSEEIALIQPGYAPTCTSHRGYFDEGKPPSRRATFEYSEAAFVFDRDPEVGGGDFQLSETGDIGLAFGLLVGNPIRPHYRWLGSNPDYGPLVWKTEHYLALGVCGGSPIFTGACSGTLRYNATITGFTPADNIEMTDRPEAIRGLATKAGFGDIRLAKNFSGHLRYTTRVFSPTGMLLGKIMFDSRDPGVVVEDTDSETRDGVEAEGVAWFASQPSIKIATVIEIENPDGQQVFIGGLLYGVAVTDHVESNLPIIFESEHPKKGTLQVGSEKGYHYYLQGSWDLGSKYHDIESKSGTGSVLRFSFDDTEVRTDSKYYRVLRSPIVPATDLVR